MNHKQKLGYTVLGAVIMLIGIGVGSIVSPPLIAQRDGVFGEIQCTGLKVVDKHGRPGIVLKTADHINNAFISELSLYDSDGRQKIIAHASTAAHSISLTNADRSGSKIELLVAGEGGGIYITHKHPTGFNPGVSLHASEEDCSLTLRQNSKSGIVLQAQKEENQINLFDSHGKRGIRLESDEIGSSVAVGTQQQNSIVLHTREETGGFIAIMDKDGNIKWTEP